MKKLLILTLLFVGVGCREGNLKGTPTGSTVSTGIVEMPIEVYVIDSCEYVGKTNGTYSDVLAHKGNCKYCKQRSVKEAVHDTIYRTKSVRIDHLETLNQN